MSTRDIAQQFTQLCKNGQFEDAGRRFWAEDVVSLEPMEGPMARSVGRKEVQAKGEWWYANHEVHATRTEGPFVHGDQFALIFDIDVTARTGEHAGQRMSMREVGLYTVRGDKVAEERFFFGG